MLIVNTYKSSAISNIAYDRKNGNLYIEMCHRGTYCYIGVSENVFTHLIIQTSKGNSVGYAFNTNVRDVFSYKKVTEIPQEV